MILLFLSFYIKRFDFNYNLSWYWILCLLIFLLRIITISIFYFKMSRVAIAAQKKIRDRRSTLIFPNLTQAGPKRSLSMPELDVSRLNFQIVHSSKTDMILPSCDLASGSQETLSSGYCSQGKNNHNFEPSKNQEITSTNENLKALPAAKDQSPAIPQNSQICIK